MTYDESPATKADIRLLHQKLDGALAAIERAVQSMERSREELQRSTERGFDRTNESIDQVLTVLCNVDQRLTDSVGSHERRIQQLERRLGLSV